MRLRKAAVMHKSVYHTHYMQWDKIWANERPYEHISKHSRDRSNELE